MNATNNASEQQNNDQQDYQKMAEIQRQNQEMYRYQMRTNYVQQIGSVLNVLDNVELLKTIFKYGIVLKTTNQNLKYNLNLQLMKFIEQAKDSEDTSVETMLLLVQSLYDSIHALNTLNLYSMQQPMMGMGMQQPMMGMGMQQPMMGMGMQQPMMGMGMQQPMMGMGMQQPMMGMGMQQPMMGMGMQQPMMGMGMQQPMMGMGMQQPMMGINVNDKMTDDEKKNVYYNAICSYINNADPLIYMKFILANNLTLDGLEDIEYFKPILSNVMWYAIAELDDSILQNIYALVYSMYNSYIYQQQQNGNNNVQQQPMMGMGMQQPMMGMGMQQPMMGMGMQQPMMGMGMQQPMMGMGMQQPMMGMGMQQPMMGMGMQQPMMGMGMQQPMMGMANSCGGGSGRASPLV